MRMTYNGSSKPFIVTCGQSTSVTARGLDRSGDQFLRCIIKGRVAARILAIDFGLKRMGLAVSDGLGLTAQGLPTLERTKREDDLRHIQRLAQEYSVERVILGHPLGHGGGETVMSHYVSEFAEKLRRRLTCSVELWDERLTSVEANRMLRDSGMSVRKRQRATDRVAATLLLQNYLDYLACEKARIQTSGVEE